MSLIGFFIFLVIAVFSKSEIIKSASIISLGLSVLTSGIESLALQIKKTSEKKNG